VEDQIRSRWSHFKIPFDNIFIYGYIIIYGNFLVNVFNAISGTGGTQKCQSQEPATPTTSGCATRTTGRQGARHLHLA
jgi:hypothetical protein